MDAATITRIITAITMLSYGAHQIAKPTKWLDYMPSFLQKLLPMPATSFMREHGGINVGLGALFLLNVKPQFVYWAVFAWWLSILPFAYYQDWRTGMRDAIIIAGIAGVLIAWYKSNKE
jgi:hypothetical protein